MESDQPVAVQNAIDRLIPAGTRVLVCYSGGADSTCLLYLLARAGIDIVAGHLHHGQRPEADGELRRCEAFAQDLNVPFVSGRADVPRLAKDMKIGLEEAGREARYGFFRRAAHETGCGLIATGHTQTDRIESVLLNLVRGTGLSGLTGIPERRDHVVRPLLTMSRAETRRFCEARGLWFHDDPANIDVTFARSRIRERILPELCAINPAAESAIARFADLAGEEDRFLNGMAAAALERAEIPLNGRLSFLTADAEIRFSVDAVGHLPAALFRRAVRLAVEAVGGTLDFTQTRVIEGGVTNGRSGSVTTEGGRVVVQWDDQSLTVRRLAEDEPFRELLTLPGETVSEEWGWSIVAYREPYAGPPPPRDALEVWVGTTVGGLYLRSVQPGDRMQPLGFAGHRKLSDLMGEAGLTPMARERLPIVCDMVGPIWAPGVCLDERARPAAQGEQGLRLRFGPAGSNI